MNRIRKTPTWPNSSAHGFETPPRTVTDSPRNWMCRKLVSGAVLGDDPGPEREEQEARAHAGEGPGEPSPPGTQVDPHEPDEATRTKRTAPVAPIAGPRRALPGVCARITHNSQNAKAVVETAVTENRRWAHAARFLTPDQEVNRRQREARRGDHRPDDGDPAHDQRAASVRAAHGYHSRRAPIRRMRGPVIAVGRSHDAPELVVSVCSALVLKMLYTSKNPMTRARPTRNAFSVRRSTSVMLGVRLAVDRFRLDRRVAVVERLHERARERCVRTGTGRRGRPESRSGRLIVPCSFACHVVKRSWLPAALMSAFGVKSFPVPAPPRDSTCA